MYSLGGIGVRFACNNILKGYVQKYSQQLDSMNTAGQEGRAVRGRYRMLSATYPDIPLDVQDAIIDDWKQSGFDPNFDWANAVEKESRGPALIAMQGDDGDLTASYDPSWIQRHKEVMDWLDSRGISRGTSEYDALSQITDVSELHEAKMKYEMHQEIMTELSREGRRKEGRL